MRANLAARLDGLVPLDACSKLETSLDRLHRWTSSLPSNSCFYQNQRPTIFGQPYQFLSAKRVETALPQIFFDLHSALAGFCLTRGWRADQLAEGLIHSLSTWNISLAASAARSLVETAASFAIETGAIADQWSEARSTVPARLDDALAMRTGLFQLVLDGMWSTRIQSFLEVAPRLQRKNVLTFIKKSEKRFGQVGLSERYEVLCDAVHPSFGSAECFWEEVGVREDRPGYGQKRPRQLRVLLNKRAVGKWGEEIKGSELPRVIFECSSWGLDRLDSDLRRLEVLCRDVSLTCRIYELAELDYWGVAKPSGKYDPCACGSGLKTRLCRHEFGCPPSSPEGAEDT